MLLSIKGQTLASPRPESVPCRLRSQRCARRPSRFWLVAEDGDNHPESGGSETRHSSTSQKKTDTMSGFWQNFTLSSYTPFGWEPGRKFESNWAKIGKYNAHWLEAGVCCGPVWHSLPVRMHPPDLNRKGIVSQASRCRQWAPLYPVEQPGGAKPLLQDDAQCPEQVQYG